MRKHVPTPKQIKNRAMRKAMGPALIVRPLRFIADKTDTVTLVDGKPKSIESPQTHDARVYAARRNGAAVRHIAREVLRAYA